MLYGTSSGQPPPQFKYDSVEKKLYLHLYVTDKDKEADHLFQHLTAGWPVSPHLFFSQLPQLYGCKGLFLKKRLFFKSMST